MGDILPEIKINLRKQFNRTWNKSIKYFNVDDDVYFKKITSTVSQNFILHKKAD
jgi:hypothetical protein